MSLPPIIMDCDPGDDDTVALLMALSSPRIEVKGITTLAGNATADQTFLNARGVCMLAGQPHIPVFKGCAQPLLRKPQYATYIHGNSGIDGAHLPVPTTAPSRIHAVDFMWETLKSTPHKVILAATAALTNIAVLIIKHPESIEKIDRIVWLGGSGGTGNVTLAAEFNAYSDPHALQVVLNSGIPFYIIPLDISHQVCTNRDFMQRLKERNTPVTLTVMNMLAHTEVYDREYYGLPGRAIHDACVIACLIEPNLFHFKKASVAVHLEEGPLVGATLFSTLKAHQNDCPSFLAVEVDSLAVLTMIEDSLCSYPITSHDSGITRK